MWSIRPVLNTDARRTIPWTWWIRDEVIEGRGRKNESVSESSGVNECSNSCNGALVPTDQEKNTSSH